MKRRLQEVLFSLAFALCFACDGLCSSVGVTNTQLGVLSGGSTTVSFDLTWNNSWRSTAGGAPAPNNWDAAWVFVKFRKNGGNWAHASLNDTGHSSGTGTSATFTIPDWSGLRPMSELEFERAARGPYRSVSGEYAWGTTAITQPSSITNAGLSTERAQSGANAVTGNIAAVQGPLRVGSCAYGVSTRIAAGAGYYGAMDLSGNIFEIVVTVGNSTGRNFEGRYHGNGALDSTGNANVSTWPGTNAVGSGYRGGSWEASAAYARTSARQYGALAYAVRCEDGGGRGVRLAP